MVACVEVGGSGVETVVFDAAGSCRVLVGAHRPQGAVLAMAVPGLIDGTRVVGASNLGWYDVDPAEQLGLDGPADLVCNDAEAAALGEWVLREGGERVVFVGVGTGVGGAVVESGVVVADNLFGHQKGFGERACRCGGIGCLETVAGGWALPAVLDGEQVRRVAQALASALAREPLAADGTIVLAGGLIDAHPGLVAATGVHLAGRRVAASNRPAGTKSAAAWGLRERLRQLAAVGSGPAPGWPAGHETGRASQPS